MRCGYLCGVPERAGELYQRADHLSDVDREAALVVVEMPGGGHGEDVVEQLGVGRRALDHSEVSLEAAWNVARAER